MKNPLREYDRGTSKFLSDIFKAKAYFNGRSMKRSQSSVERWSSEAALVEEAKSRGMRLLKTNGEYILLDAVAELHWLVGQPL